MLTTTGSGNVQFRVKLDHLGHTMIECCRGTERTETGVRGLPNLIHNGWMLKPKSFHVDPLLTYVEVDGVRFASSPEGVAQLQQALNESYAPALQAQGDNPVEIKENPAAATGFDIRFVIYRAGTRFEVKGHLSQQYLDVLQDASRCELLRHGTVLRLTPPYLVIRHRRPDGSEEKLPEIPDLEYRHATASQLQQILNHPLIRRNPDATQVQSLAATDQSPAELVELRITRNPQNKLFLWLESVTTRGAQGKAFTHHNVGDLQHSGVFQPQFDVVLSLDNRTLSLLNKETREEAHITIDPNSPDADLKRAGQMLSAALKLPSPRHAEAANTPAIASATAPAPVIGAFDLPFHEGSSKFSGVSGEARPPVTKPQVAIANEDCSPARELARASVSSTMDPELSAAPTSESTRSFAQPPQMLPKAPLIIETTPTLLDPAIMELFCETDPARIHIEIFRVLASSLAMPVQDVQLSLPRVFENRRFEVLSFSHSEITDVLEIRSSEFAGCCLSYVNEKKILLDYAWYGKRVEWGPQKASVQTSVSSDPDEFNGAALKGMAVNEDSQFVFVVTSAFKQWVKSREKQFAEAGAHFASVEEVAADPKRYPLLWPGAAY